MIFCCFFSSFLGRQYTSEMGYADDEYKAVEEELGIRREDVEKLIMKMKMILRMNAGPMKAIGWKRGIMWVRHDGSVESWVWCFGDLLRKLWMLRVGLLSGLLERLMWRILRKNDRWLIRDDFVVSLPPEVEGDGDECCC